MKILSLCIFSKINLVYTRFIISRFTVTCLSVVTSVESHSVLPKVFEEGGQDLCLDVVGLYTISSTALLHHLGTGQKAQVRAGTYKNIPSCHQEWL
jgi:hypothetical protein